MAVAPIVLWSLAAGAAGAGAGALASGAFKKQPKAPEVPALPAAPDPAIAAQDATQAISKTKRKAMIPGSTSGRAGTLLTGPGGLLGSAPTQTKTLLGS